MSQDNTPEKGLTIREVDGDISAWAKFVDSVPADILNQFTGEIVIHSGVVARKYPYNQTQLDIIESQGGFDEDED